MKKGAVYTTQTPAREADPQTSLRMWQSTPTGQVLSGALRSSGAPGAWLVGGAVRDLLLGRTDAPADLDVALPAEAAGPAARSVAAALGGSPFLLDPRTGAWRVALPERGSVDLVPLRAPTIEEDLAGRDFTVNAVAWDLLGPGELVDPLRGLEDLAAGVLRVCSPRALDDDPVRVLRAYRFAVELGFGFSPELPAMLAAAARGLRRVAPERVRTELFLVLGLDGGARALRTMAGHGVLEVLFPFTARWHGFDQGDYHAHDLFEHSLRTAEAAEDLATHGEGLPDPGRLRAHLAEELEQDVIRKALLVLSAFLHDAAKPDTAFTDPDGRRRFFGHEGRGGHRVRKLLESLRVGRRARGAAQRVVAAHLRLFQLAEQNPPTERARLRYLRDLRSEVPEALILSLADEMATGPAPPALAKVRRTAAELMGLYWELRDRRKIPPLIRGGDLVQELGIPPGPDVGEILRAVEEAEAAGRVSTRNEALALARRLWAERAGEKRRQRS